MAIGLVVEYWEPVREFIEEWRRPAAVFPWHKFMGMAGGILVTIGVFGEFWGAYRASRVETKLRDNNHQIETLLRDKASKNEKDAAQLRKDAEQLRKDAEDERSARIKVEGAVAWRRLSKQQRSMSVPSLKRFHKGVTTEAVGMSYPVNSVEGFMFAEDIAAFLRANEWHVFRPWGVEDFPAPGTPVLTGILVRNVGNEADRAAAKALVEELHTLGFDATLGPELDRPTLVGIDIEIDLRPEGPQGEAKLREANKKKQSQSTK